MLFKRIVKTLFIALNWLFVVLLVGSTLAGEVAPSKFIGFSLLSYGYLYFLVVNVVFIIVWLCVGSRWFALSLAAILARCGFLPLFFQIGGTAVLSGDEGSDGMMKVMTFNTHSFKGAGWGGGDDAVCLDANMSVFLSTVDEESPDVIVMQEYKGKGDTMHLTRQLERRGYIHQTSGYDNGRIVGEVIFAKVPILRVVRIGGPSKFFADMAWDDDTVRIYCLHLGSYGLTRSDQQQIHDMAHGNADGQTGRGTLRKFSSTIREHEEEWDVLKTYFVQRERLTVVAGDFNETPASYFYRRCSEVFVDSYCEAGQGFSTTYHGTFTQQRATTFPAFRIDMVMHTHDIEAVAYKRVRSDVSDHYPVIVTLKKK